MAEPCDTIADGEGSPISEATNESTKTIRGSSVDMYEDFDGKESVYSRQSARKSVFPVSDGQIKAEWIDQYEPGVYITLVAFWDGTRDLKCVRFSRRRFGEHPVETWWSENRDKVYQKYNVRPLDKSPVRRSFTVFTSLSLER